MVCGEALVELKHGVLVGIHMWPNPCRPLNVSDYFSVNLHLQEDLHVNISLLFRRSSLFCPSPVVPKHFLSSTPLMI